MGNVSVVARSLSDRAAVLFPSPGPYYTCSRGKCGSIAALLAHSNCRFRSLDPSHHRCGVYLFDSSFVGVESVMYSLRANFNVHNGTGRVRFASVFVKERPKIVLNKASNFLKLYSPNGKRLQLHI